MIYYSYNSNKILDTKDFHYFDQGMSAFIYRAEDTDILLKRYKVDTPNLKYISKFIFDYLKSKDIPGLVKLRERYHLYPFLNFLSPDCYTMDLVKGKRVELLDMDNKYILFLAKQLELTLKFLCDSKIILFDVHRRNIIYTENNITIIDPDSFYKVTFMSKREIYQKNKKTILDGICDTLSHEYFNHPKRDNNDILPIIIPSYPDTSLTNDLLSYFCESSLIDSILKQKESIKVKKKNKILL